MYKGPLIHSLHGSEFVELTLNNVFKEAELKRENNVHFLHVNGVKKPVPYYTLDVIISVGYRVHSQRGVRFRQWANGVLKQYLVKSYAINENIRKQQIAELRQLVQVVGRTIQQQPAKSTDESNALTLMIAESKTEEKDIMVKVVVNLINQAN